MQNTAMATRILLHSAGVPEPVGGADVHADEHGMDLAAVNTLDLRIAAIFAILAGAVLCGLPTLLLKQFQDPDAAIPRLLRAFAGGVIVALALVHISPEAVTDLNSLIEYPIGGCTILFGILSLVLIDSTLAALMATEPQKQHIRDSLKGVAAADAATNPHQHHQHQHGPSSDAKQLPEDAEQGLPAGSFSAQQPHTHQCTRSLSASSWLASGAAPVNNIRQYVTAYTMELGCIFHSVIIGVGLGVLTSDRRLAVTLMVALVVHQGLEALALGTVLALTTFGFVKKLAMLLMYSITTPIGIAVGIAVSSSYDPESVTSRAVQGTMNGISAGMLLYIGMYQLIAEEFSREDMLVRPKLRFGMYAALCLGAAAMCLLAIWS